jgi:putative restriction endonuclease
MEQRVPVIYFLGIAPGRNQTLRPTFTVGFDRAALKARLAFGEPDEIGTVPDSPTERRYAARAKSGSAFTKRVSARR